MASIRGGKENTTDGDFGGILSLYTRVNGGSDTERVRITSAGNVGIGTTSPARKLDIVSNAPLRLGTSTTDGMEIIQVNTNQWGLYGLGAGYIATFGYF